MVFKTSPLNVWDYAAASVCLFSLFRAIMENTTVIAGKSGIIEAEAKLVIKDFVEVIVE